MTTVSVPTAKTYSRSIDYLGALGKTLRDLAGYAALAYELVQNAEDARASTVSVRILPDALVIDNDGVFSDCGQLDEAECPWAAPEERGHRCDFHRFRIIAGADKRNELDTVGAFGIGFTAVYQITDLPHLISAGRHWVVDETRDESSRIIECGGCDQCRAERLPGTRIRLPWARDPNSELRRRLQAEAVPITVEQDVERELLRALPTAMLFLRSVSRIDVEGSAGLIERIEREAEEDRILLATNAGTAIWHVVRGNFAEEARALREKHGGRIESKRGADVVVAVPEAVDVPGLLCAFLPTQYQTGLPFHIQADFFPTSDRKRVILDAGYQAEWNDTAVRAAARALAASVPALRDTVGRDGLWRMARAVNDVALETNRGERDACLGAFWTPLAQALATQPTVWTMTGRWVIPRDAVIAERTEEEPALETLCALGVPLVDPSLRPFLNLLRAKEIGVRLLDIQDIAERISGAGLQSPCASDDIPEVFRGPDVVRSLWSEFQLLLQRSRREEDRRRARSLVASCPIVPCRDGSWRSADETYVASSDAAELCARLRLEVPIAELDDDLTQIVGDFAGKLDTGNIVEELRAALESQPPLAITPEAARAFFDWIDERRSTWTADPVVKRSIASLPVFPCAAGLQALTDLVLPGDFEDPLGVTDLVDLAALDGRRELLRELGAAVLTLREYTIRHLPRAFSSGRLSNEERRRAVHLLVDRFGELQDNIEVVSALERVALVECTDGEWRSPGDVYLASELVRAVLGSNVPIAIASESEGALRTLLLTLGVAENPRVEDVLRRIEAGDGDPGSATARSATGEMLRFLARAQKAEQIDEEDLRRVKTRAWLPARGDSERWYQPSELHAIYREAIFATAAVFLDVPLAIQQEATELLRDIGVGRSPTVTQVVTHLLNCARTGQDVSSGVYEFLSREITDANVRALEPLKTAPFIMRAGGRPLSARQVFWSGHPFGEWRYTLGSELRQYQRLFDAVDVRESPTWQDALAVLTDLSTEFGATHRALTPDATAVAASCWRMLSEALETDQDGAREAIAGLRSKPVVPSRRGMLEAPEYLLFEDRTDFARRFPILQSVAIARPEGAWGAMTVAGVRSLSQAIHVDLLERDGLRDDHVLRQRVVERRHALKRVFASEKAWGGLARADAQGVWDEMRFTIADRVVVRYTLDLFGRPVFSEPESPVAVYFPDEHTIMRVAGSSERVWAAIAREMARAVDRDGEHSGALAGCIRDVLAAGTAEDVESILDDLGYPAVIEASADAAAPAMIDALGREATPGEDEASSALPDEADVDDGGSPDHAVGHRKSAPPSESVDEDGGSRSTGNGSSDDDGSGDGNDSQLRKRAARKRAGGSSDRTPRPQSRLRSYVGRTTEDGVSPSPGETDARDALDRAGVDAVLEYERAKGRNPQEMHHTHPGYDVESRDGHGDIVRYIEVKSTGEPWLDRGVALSDVQFDKARTLGSAYWLYVVVRPGREGAELIRIQDPASRVAQYIFDGGWRVAAEDESDDSSD